MSIFLRSRDHSKSSTRSGSFAPAGINSADEKSTLRTPVAESYRASSCISRLPCADSRTVYDLPSSSQRAGPKRLPANSRAKMRSIHSSRLPEGEAEPPACDFAGDANGMRVSPSKSHSGAKPLASAAPANVVALRNNRREICESFFILRLLGLYESRLRFPSASIDGHALCCVAGNSSRSFSPPPIHAARKMRTNLGNIVGGASLVAALVRAEVIRRNETRQLTESGFAAIMICTQPTWEEKREPW